MIGAGPTSRRSSGNESRSADMEYLPRTRTMYLAEGVRELLTLVEEDYAEAQRITR